MSLSHQDSFSSTGTRSDSKGSKASESKENYSERESVMTFHEEFFRHHQPQYLEQHLDDSSQSQDTYQLSESEGFTDRLLDDTTAGRLAVADSPDVFYCTLPVVERHGVIDKEATGINAARRKQRATMIVCNSDCSTLSSNRTMNASPSVDIGDTCGCFQRLRIGVVRPSHTVSPSPYNGRNKNDGRLTASIVATETATKSSCCFAMYNNNTQQNTGCLSPPSAVQTFSFADTKIGNAVSDAGLVVRVNSCRGGQHRVDDKFHEESLRGIHDGLSLFISGKKQEATSRWRKSKTTSTPGSEPDLTGNFTLVSRRCTEVRRAFAHSRHRWPQLAGCTNSGGRPSSACEPRNSTTEQHTKIGRNSFSSATIGSAASSAWRRLVAGLEVAAVDGRRLLGNCRHAGDTVGLLSLSSGRSYDVLTRNMA